MGKKDKRNKHERWGRIDDQRFIRLFTLSQADILNDIATQLLQNKYRHVLHSPAFVYGRGEAPILLIAHADTVHDRRGGRSGDGFLLFERDNTYWSPYGLGADDRAGIWALRLLMRHPSKPHILVTTDEESGGRGARIAVDSFIPEGVQYMIELDRRNHRDAVYYDLDCKDLEKYIELFGYKPSLGSFTDISILMPAWKLPGVNLSVGYSMEHSERETLYLPSLNHTIDTVSQLLEEPEIPKFKYAEQPSWWERWNADVGWKDGWKTPNKRPVGFKQGGNGEVHKGGHSHGRIGIPLSSVDRPGSGYVYVPTKYRLSMLETSDKRDIVDEAAVQVAKGLVGGNLSGRRLA